MPPQLRRGLDLLRVVADADRLEVLRGALGELVHVRVELLRHGAGVRAGRLVDTRSGAWRTIEAAELVGGPSPHSTLLAARPPRPQCGHPVPAGKSRALRGTGAVRRRRTPGRRRSRISLARSSR